MTFFAVCILIFFIGGFHNIFFGTNSSTTPVITLGDDKGPLTPGLDEAKGPPTPALDVAKDPTSTTLDFSKCGKLMT